MANKLFSEDNRLERIGRSGINYIVIGMCMLSLVLCCRAIYRAQLLKRVCNSEPILRLVWLYVL